MGEEGFALPPGGGQTVSDFKRASESNGSRKGDVGESGDSGSSRGVRDDDGDGDGDGGCDGPERGNGWRV